jgi:hypothetical protein
MIIANGMAKKMSLTETTTGRLSRSYRSHWDIVTRIKNQVGGIMNIRELLISAVAVFAVLTLAGCSSNAPSAAPKAEATIDPIAVAITERWGDCLRSLKFTEPFDITVYHSTNKADVSNEDYSTVIFFHTGTSNTGNLITIPDEADGSARALASVGC